MSGASGSQFKSRLRKESDMEDMLFLVGGFVLGCIATKKGWLGKLKTKLLALVHKG